jgi:hypothetical protein
MSKSRHPEIRLLLRQFDDGMTARSISEYIGASQTVVYKSLQSMPDAYIDRWANNPGARGQFESVWCVIVPPDNCPHPKD